MYIKESDRSDGLNCDLCFFFAFYLFFYFFFLYLVKYFNNKRNNKHLLKLNLSNK